MLGLACLSLVLAALTWRFVERPFRNRHMVSAKQVLRYGLTTTLSLLALIGAASFLGPSVDDYPPEMRQFVVAHGERTAYVESEYNKLVNDNFQNDSRRKLLLIGDSFSQDFYNMIRESGAFAGYQIVTRRLRAVCQLYLGDEDIAPFLDPADRVPCAESLQAADLRGLAGQADVVIFALSWRPWSGERIAQTVANFGFHDDQKVLVIGRKNFGYFNLRGFLRAAPEAFPNFRSAPLSEHLLTNATMKRSLPPSIFVDTHSILCGDRPDCPLFTPTGELIAFDGNHLTQAGANIRWLAAVPRSAACALRPERARVPGR